VLPADGVIWTPVSEGLLIRKIAEPRDVSFSPGQRIVFVNGTSWEETADLHASSPFHAPAVPRVGYEIRDGEWKLRRQVLQAPLAASTSLRIYGWRAAILLFLATIFLGRLRPLSETAPLLAFASAMAVWTLAGQNLTLLHFFGLRHLEITAALIALGLGGLLRYFLGSRNRFADTLPFVAMLPIGLSWIVMDDRWLWWRFVQWSLLFLGGCLALAAAARYGSANRFSGS
jgi:hypothetical protein